MSLLRPLTLGVLAIVALANVVLGCAAGRPPATSAAPASGTAPAAGSNAATPSGTAASTSAAPSSELPTSAPTDAPTTSTPRGTSTRVPSTPGASAVPGATPRWELAWADEFDGAAGTTPDRGRWTYDLGDGSGSSVAGWGNQELEYYTDDAQNASMDGKGSLVITARADDGKRACYYGPCRYTSARLLTRGTFEFQYGRIEARIKVPTGFGMWPAFWMLGTDIGQVGWPRCGEIDVMEVVGRLPNRVFGTLHGPGYSGNSGFGGTLDLDRPVAEDFHTFAVEWTAAGFVWTVDGTVFHRAAPADVAPNAWPYDHPFFLLLNVAVGGQFAGPVGPETTFPQAMTVDYVRVYRAARS